MIAIDIHEALDRLEDNLVAPIVPGELENWLAVLSQSADMAGELLWSQIETIHRFAYAQMVDQDPALYPRVEQLKQRDLDNLVQFENFLDRIAKMKGNAGQFEPDEAVVQPKLDSLIEQGLAWVIRAKRLEQARKIWFFQAFNRERGVVD